MEIEIMPNIVLAFFGTDETDEKSVPEGQIRLF
jgi:hypothetical protein